MTAASAGRLTWTVASVLAVAACAALANQDAPTAGIERAYTVASSPIALDEAAGILWVVNPDADSVTAVDLATLEARPPVPVGREPWSIAVAAAGTVVVANRLDGTLTILEPARTRHVGVGPELGGVAIGGGGRIAYVTSASDGIVAVVDIASARVVERVSVGTMPGAIAVRHGASGDEIVVAHRIARPRPGASPGTNAGREAWLTVIAPDRSMQEIVIDPYAFGFANALEGLAVVGDEVWVTHLLNRPEPPTGFQHSVSAALTVIDARARAVVAERSQHLNEATFSTPTHFPRAVAAAPGGATAYVVLAGTNAVMAVDRTAPEAPRLLGFWAVGQDPRGIAVDAAARRAYVMNHLSRSVSVIELTNPLTGPPPVEVPVVHETLPAAVHRGKVLFHNANDPRLSRLGWLSCAGCHIDGGADGTTWSTSDGPRQTMPLWALDRTAPFHASATRDELQDVEFDLLHLMGGVGLVPGEMHEPLGAPNAGRSSDLDALAEFLAVGIRVPRAPTGVATAVARGRDVFVELGCSGCHGGSAWTISQVPAAALGGDLVTDLGELRAALFDVGTFDATADVLGAAGFDVPTLLGLHATGPYFHAGTATLEEVIRHPTHGHPELSDDVVRDLVAFLRSIDDRTVPFGLPEAHRQR